MDIAYLSFPQPTPRETDELWSRQVVHAVGRGPAGRLQPEGGGNSSFSNWQPAKNGVSQGSQGTLGSMLFNVLISDLNEGIKAYSDEVC